MTKEEAVREIDAAITMIEAEESEKEIIAVLLGAIDGLRE